MCFSATASFGASAVLLAAGTVTVLKVKQKNDVFFAAIPLLFGLQQFCEGFVWLSFTHPSFAFIHTIAIKAFLFFAHILWPSWIAVAILRMETIPLRRKILCSIISIGLTLSFCEIYCAFAYPIDVSIIGKHIDYSVQFPKTFNTISSILYGIVTFIPCFISSQKKVWLFGVTLIVSFIAAKFLYEDYVISVWCFFAALLSLVISYILQTRSSKI